MLVVEGKKGKDADVWAEVWMVIVFGKSWNRSGGKHW